MTPVVLLVFNRPEQLRQVWSAVRQAQVPRLHVVADAPRPGHPTDQERCAEVRAMLEAPDWACEVSMDTAPHHLGCRKRVLSGLNATFESFERAIILEDDCVPEPTFFTFCRELLDRYAHDQRVSHITGTNYLGRWAPHDGDWFFAPRGGIWGWATWRRAWQLHDDTMPLWPTARRERWLDEIAPGTGLHRRLAPTLDRAMDGSLDSWAYPWLFTRLVHRMVAAVPRHNLIANIGFQEESTHTQEPDHPFAALETAPLPAPLRPPSGFVPSLDYERRVAAAQRQRGTALQRLRGRVLDRARRLSARV